MLEVRDLQEISQDIGRILVGGTRTGSVWHQSDQAPLARPRILRVLPLCCLAGVFEAFR
jgi:hypothetical protein